MIYLDNAATSPTPQRVLNAMNEYHREYNANVHRSIHSMGERATTAYHDARERIATFIGAHPDEVVFTKNTTESLNLAAHTLTRDTTGGIVVTEMEHHSNLVPWQQLAQRRDLSLDYIPVRDGRLDMDVARELIGDDTAVVAAVHGSNFLGTVNRIDALARLAHEHDAVMVADAAQTVPHMPVDVDELAVDMLAFSGHKMLGPTGVGVLYARDELLEGLPPFLYGGDMIHTVGYDDTTFADPPVKYEAGTPPIAQVIGLGKAVEILEEKGMQAVHEHTRRLAQTARRGLDEHVPGVTLYGHADIGIVSFTLDGVHPHDIGSYLSEECDIATRSGHHCVMPLHDKLGVQATCRASFYVQNSEDDVEALVAGVKDCAEVFDV